MQTEEKPIEIAPQPIKQNAQPVLIENGSIFSIQISDKKSRHSRHGSHSKDSRSVSARRTRSFVAIEKLISGQSVLARHRGDSADSRN
jgi:hypothetical protein